MWTVDHQLLVEASGHCGLSDFDLVLVGVQKYLREGAEALEDNADGKHCVIYILSRPTLGHVCYSFAAIT